MLADDRPARREIMRVRTEIEEYISRFPEFRTSLTPLAIHPDAPESVRRMLCAAALTGTGPMAAVAGTIAEYAARRAWHNGEKDIIIDNGGDLFCIIQKPIHTALYAGKNSPFNTLAFRIESGDTPLAVCSSSGTMGHSASFGSADLVTILSSDAALADCAATMTANKINSAADLQTALQWAAAVPGIRGGIAVKDGKIALAGTIPQLIRHDDNTMPLKITGLG